MRQKTTKTDNVNEAFTDALQDYMQEKCLDFSCLYSNLSSSARRFAGDGFNNQVAIFKLCC